MLGFPVFAQRADDDLVTQGLGGLPRGFGDGIRALGLRVFLVAQELHEAGNPDHHAGQREGLDRIGGITGQQLFGNIVQIDDEADGRVGQEFRRAFPKLGQVLLGEYIDWRAFVAGGGAIFGEEAAHLAQCNIGRGEGHDQ